MNREVVSEEDFELVKRAAWDCIPPVRASLLKALREGRKPHTAGFPKATTDRALEDLKVMGLVESDEAGPFEEESYDLSDVAKMLLAEAEGKG